MEQAAEVNRSGRDFAEMLKGGVIMDVMNEDQARIAESAGAVAVMALEMIPSDIRKCSNDVVRMSDPEMIQRIVNAVSIPVMAKCRIGHFVEAQILQELKVDFIDESEVLTVADDSQHIDKSSFSVPFVCGAVDFWQALRRISEGASMIRSKGEAGTGNIVQAIKHIRAIRQEIERIAAFPSRDSPELMALAEANNCPLKLLQQVYDLKRLPVVNFAAGGVATPADAAMCMQLGVDGVFVGSAIFRSSNPSKRAEGIVRAVTHFRSPAAILLASRNLGAPMKGIADLSINERWSEKENVKRDPKNHRQEVLG